MQLMWWPPCSIDQIQASHGGQNEGNTLLQHSQHCHKGEYWHVSISAQQQLLRCGQSSWAFPERIHCWWQLERMLEWWRTTGRQKGSYLHHQGEFLHNGVVRIFVALSCELWGYLHYITLHYITSGSYTTGSRSNSLVGHTHSSQSCQVLTLTLWRLWLQPPAQLASFKICLYLGC